MQDMERGRLFRLAPPGAKYKVSKFDWSTPKGAVEALANPCNSVRYMAYKALIAMGKSAVPSLKTMAGDTNPRMRARAYWLLARLDGAQQTFNAASKDTDADVRAAAIRMARQAKLSTTAIVPALLGDKSPVVLRELAIALREDTSKEMPEYWGRLASQFDGQDRWYLEALGIAATDRWDECLTAYRRLVPADRNSRSQRLIAWRGRGDVAAQMQSEWLRSQKLDEAETMALFRAIDFLAPEQRAAALKPLLDLQDRPRTVIEALMRLEGVDLQGSPKLAQLVRDYVDQLGQDPAQLKILQRLKVAGMTDPLLERAAAWGASTQAVQALDLALETGGSGRLREILEASPPSELGDALSKALSLSNRKEAMELQQALLESESVAKSVRVEAAVGLSRNKANHANLLALARQNRLPAEARPLLGSALRASEDPEIRKSAEALFPMLKSSQNALPPIDVLAKKTGNADNGRAVYFGAATCSQCHMVGSEGKNVGPSLTEIGNKLTRDAMYVSILSPSAGISHSFEAYTARNNDGEVVTGLLVSKTDSGVTIKDAKGIERTIPASELDEFRKQEKSLMPENLQETMSEGELVDLVEYLMTLRK
jgi:putative heme-binding domain-containing protein